MNFELNKSIEVLERTPLVLEALLTGISNDWIMNNEGPDTWSPYDVLGHLIHGEKTDWIPRMEKVLAENGDKQFTPFDRFAQFTESKGKSLTQLINEFKLARANNLKILRSKNLQADDLLKTAVHPALGTVTMQQLLSTWVVHDLSHIGQITRVMARQYKTDVGPWIEYMGILTR